jgi:hypothetical protein
MEERVEGFREDLNQGLAAIRSELAEMKNEQAVRAKERRTMMLALVIAGIGLTGTFVATLLPLLGGHP